MPDITVVAEVASEQDKIHEILNESLYSIRPIPKAPPRKGTKRGRKPGRTAILTDPDEMASIADQLKAKQEAEQAMRNKKRRGRQSTKAAIEPQPQGSSTSNPGKRNTKRVRRRNYYESSDSD